MEVITAAPEDAMARDYKFKQMDTPEMIAALDTAIEQIGQLECDEGDLTGVMPLMWITAVRDSLAALETPDE